MTGHRYRLISTQGAHEHISSVVMSREEAVESLAIEAELHAQADWLVTAAEDVVVCRRGAIERVLTMRGFSPLEDV